VKKLFDFFRALLPKHFEELAKLRVEIAKDVIYRLQNPQEGYYATIGAYLRFRDTQGLTDMWSLLHDDMRTDDLQQHVEDMEGHCEVCALGGLLLSKARLCDNVPLNNFYTIDEDGDKTWAFNQNRVKNSLIDIFGKRQLSLIESAFEVTPYYANTLSFNKKTAVEFGRRFVNSKDRMIAIMENIIQNNGDFVP